MLINNVNVIKENTYKEVDYISFKQLLVNEIYKTCWNKRLWYSAEFFINKISVFWKKLAVKRKKRRLNLGLSQYYKFARNNL